MSVDFKFEEQESLTRTDFNPSTEYDKFLTRYSQGLSANNIRLVFLNLGKLKKALKTAQKEKVVVKFGSLELNVINTHNPSMAPSSLANSDLTLHRLSAFCARRLWDIVKHGDADEAALWKEKIIIPLAEVAGINWENCLVPEFYISFASGSEFFLKEFKMYPVAVGIVKVQKNLMSPDYLGKILRQRYGQNLPVDWMESQKETVKLAIATVSKHPLTRAKFQPHVSSFLKDLGLADTTVSSIVRSFR
ncbi:N [Bangui virus]|nr:N [Bangui virus] [Bangui virus]